VLRKIPLLRAAFPAGIFIAVKLQNLKRWPQRPTKIPLAPKGLLQEKLALPLAQEAGGNMPFRSAESS